jgi:hypothetical protein
MADNEWWLVAVPGRKSGPEREWNVLSEKLKVNSSCFRFSIPDLKVHNLIQTDLYPSMNLLIHPLHYQLYLK